MNRIVDTICRDCVFATHDLDDDQDGCVLGRLEPLAANGAVIEREEDEDGSTYFRIGGRNCTTARNSEWAATRADQSADGLIRAVREEVEPRVLEVVYAGPESTDEQVERSLASLAAQSIPIRRVAICLALQMGRAEAWASRLLVDEPGVPWDVINGEEPTEGHLEQYGLDPYLRMVDEAVRDAKSPHYTAARAGFEWPPGYVEAFHRAEQHEMRRILAVLAAPGRPCEGYLTSNVAHFHLYENRGRPFCDKIAEAAEAEGAGRAVATWADLGLEATCES